MLDDFNQAPAFQLAKRAGFCNANGVTHLGLILLIVCIKTFDLLHDLSKFWVRDSRRGFDHDCLLHFRRNDLADALLAESTGRLGGSCVGFLAHVVLFDRRSGCLISLGQNRLHSGDFSTKDSDLTGFFQLTPLLLQAKMEHLLLQFPLAGFQFVAT